TSCDGFVGEVTASRRSGRRAAVINPDYVILRPLTTTGRPGSTAAMIYGHTVFFRESERIVDLRHLDFRTATVETPGAQAGRCAVSVRTTAAGAELLGALTAANIGKQLGVFVNHRLICAPLVMSPITDMIIIDGEFTQSHAEDIVKSLHRGGTA